ncbi:MAG: hypothetical protein AAGI01_16065 [Myxococcota bacterium]
MVRGSARFVDETLWPEYDALSDTLTEYLDDVTELVIREAFGVEDTDAEVVSKPPQLTNEEG